MATPKSIVITLQNGTERTLLATWVWTQSNTDHYEVTWQYQSGNLRKGEPVWLSGAVNSTTGNVKNDLYTAPDNAIQVRMSVLPIAKTHKVTVTQAVSNPAGSTSGGGISDNSPTVTRAEYDKALSTINGGTTYSSSTKTTTDQAYWTATASSFVIKDLGYINDVPDVPAVPTMSITNNKMQLDVDIYDTKTKQIEFQVYSLTTQEVRDSSSKIVELIANHASLNTKIHIGSTYKVRCRAINGTKVSAWSQYSNTDTTIPNSPGAITSCTATTATSIMVEWTAVSGATEYTVEYATDKTYFDLSDQVQSRSVTAPEVKALISGLETGNVWYFRVKATNDKGSSGWTALASAIAGSKPEAPTTWSDTSTAIIGDIIFMHWVHNAVDGSKQTTAEVQTYENDVEQPIITITDATSMTGIATSGYADGMKLKWKVRTKGVDEEWSPWSTLRTISMYMAPTIGISSNIQNGICIGYPLNVVLDSDPITQNVIAYTITISSKEAYMTVDDTGKRISIIPNQILYYKNFEASTHDFSVSLTPGDVNLDNNHSYLISASVTMDTGLSDTSTYSFTTAWTDTVYYPQLGVGILYNNISALLCPSCTDENDNPITDVTLAVYRREYDGSFVQIAKDIPGAASWTQIIDPHPALDYARYRVVARSNSTGEIGYTDVPGAYIGESAVIIQWDEDWSNFSGDTDEQYAVPVTSGSMIRLPFNIDVSDSYNPDTALVKYIGRKRPVSYYGTQLGETSNWSVEILKFDANLLYAIRRLAIWPGDVYVREPSGSGYWANIQVTISQTHNEMTIPVSFSVTRVEGGI